jgi:hypothetical protein
MTLSPSQSIFDTRRAQMFPLLDTSEIERVRRFGKRRHPQLPVSKAALFDGSKIPVTIRAGCFFSNR